MTTSRLLRAMPGKSHYAAKRGRQQGPPLPTPFNSTLKRVIECSSCGREIARLRQPAATCDFEVSKNRQRLQFFAAGEAQNPRDFCNGRKEPEGKNAKGENFAEEKMFAEDISEDFSEDRRYHFYWILSYFGISSKSSRKIAFF